MGYLGCCIHYSMKHHKTKTCVCIIIGQYLQNYWQSFLLIKGLEHNWIQQLFLHSADIWIFANQRLRNLGVLHILTMPACLLSNDTLEHMLTSPHRFLMRLRFAL